MTQTKQPMQASVVKQQKWKHKTRMQKKNSQTHANKNSNKWIQIQIKHIPFNLLLDHLFGLVSCGTLISLIDLLFVLLLSFFQLSVIVKWFDNWNSFFPLLSRFLFVAIGDCAGYYLSGLKNSQIIGSCFRKQTDLLNVANHSCVTFICYRKTINMSTGANINHINWDFRNLSKIMQKSWLLLSEKTGRHEI